MKKRILAVIVCIFMLAALLPVTAYAAGATSVKIWGVTLDADNPYYVNGAGGAAGSVSADEPDTWNAHYDPTTGVLTLNGLNVVNSTAEVDGNNSDFSSTSAIYAGGDLTLELVGTNTVSGYGEDRSSGLSIRGSLTVRSTAGGRHADRGGGRHGR